MLTNEQISQKANEYGSHEYEQDSFYAGAKWMQEQSMRWVKASEQLPEGRGEKNSVLIRSKTGFNNDPFGHSYKAPFVTYGYVNYDKETPRFYFNLGSKSFLTNENLEWLYEPPTTE